MTRRRNFSHVYHILTTKNFSIRFIFRIICIEQQERNRQAKISITYKVLVFCFDSIMTKLVIDDNTLNKFDEIATRITKFEIQTKSLKTIKPIHPRDGILRLLSLGLVRSLVLFRRKTKIRNSSFLQASSGVTNERREAPKNNDKSEFKKKFYTLEKPFKNQDVVSSASNKNWIAMNIVFGVEEAKDLSDLISRVIVVNINFGRGGAQLLNIFFLFKHSEAQKILQPRFRTSRRNDWQKYSLHFTKKEKNFCGKNNDFELIFKPTVPRKSKNKFAVNEYLDDISINNLTKEQPTPDRKWNRVHTDDK